MNDFKNGLDEILKYQAAQSEAFRSTCNVPIVPEYPVPNNRDGKLNNKIKMHQKSNFGQLSYAKTNNEVTWQKCYGSQGDQEDVLLDEDDAHL